MALDFPASPTVGQQFNDWVFDGTAWRFAQTLPGGLPAGSILPWAGATAPVNWLLCDGSAVSRTTYASLFSVVGTTYGAGNGTSTFNLPDLRGRVPVGRDSTQTEFDVLGETGGSKTNTHNHFQSVGYDGTSFYAQNYTGRPRTKTAITSRGIQAMTQSTLNARYDSTDDETISVVQPYQVVNYIIKATAAVTPGESELAGRVGSVEAVNTTQNSRLTSLETADATTNKAGLVPIVPSSVSVGSGTASVSSDGLITLSGASSISLNNAFTSDYRNFRIEARFLPASGAVNIAFKFRTGGVDNSTASYSNNGTIITAGAFAGINNVGLSSGLNAVVGYATVPSGLAMEFYSPQRAEGTSFSSISNGHTGNALNYLSFTGYWGASTQFDGISFITSASNVSGTIQVYGYR